jgi:DoxX-like family
MIFDDANLNVSRTSFSVTSPSRGRRWTGRVLSGLGALFLAFDGVMKVLQVPMVVKASHELGFSAASIFWIGVVLLACLALYLIPRTAVAGAILVTGFLGGAIATNVHAGQPLFTHILFPIYVAAFVWGGLYLRDPRVRALLGRRA